MKYTIQGKDIDLDLNKFVFKPSPHGSSALGSSIKISPGEKVLDVGTGTGILAILSAKFGGNVSATDILPQAVSLTKSNAKKNDVFIDVRLGNLFEPFSHKKFDVIIANIPQENLSPKVKEFLSEESIISMDGGEDDNNLLLKVLKSAPAFMFPDSKLYIVVYSLSSFRKILKEITEGYEAKMINFYTGPVKDFVYSDIEWYLNKSMSGDICIYKNGEEYWADLFVFELKLKR